MPFHLKFSFYVRLDGGEIYVHAITPNRYLLFSVVECGLIVYLPRECRRPCPPRASQPRPVYQFPFLFAPAKYFSHRADGKSLTKQLFDNGRFVKCALSAFYRFKLIDTHQQLK